MQQPGETLLTAFRGALALRFLSQKIRYAVRLMYRLLITGWMNSGKMLLMHTRLQDAEVICTAKDGKMAGCH